MRNNLHILPRDGAWVVLETDGAYELARLNSRERAVNLGKCLAEECHCDLFIYDDSGQLAQRVSYRQPATAALAH